MPALMVAQVVALMLARADAKKPGQKAAQKEAQADPPAPGDFRELNWLLAVTGGVLTFLPFPSWNLHYLAWFCAVPILLAARNANVRQGFGLGLLAGTVTNLGGFHWMTEMLREFGHLPMPVATAILLLQSVTQGLTMAVGVALWRWLVRRGAPVGLAAFLALWAGEAAVPMIFPWFLGNSLSPELEMIQIADLGGVHLVSALAWAVNAAVFEALAWPLTRKAPAWKFLVAVGGSVVATWVYGSWRLPQVDADQAAAPKVSIGVVEGNIGIWEKEARYLDPRKRALTLRHNLILHQRMSQDLEKQGAELIVWPESAYMPYGPLPVVHTADRFLAVGAGGAIWRHDGKRFRAEAPDRLGLPRDLAMVTALSSPRGDLWRAVDAGKRIVSVSPAGAWLTAVPEGETIVATASPSVDWTGQVPDGWVVGRSGQVWRLGWPKAATDLAPPSNRQPVSNTEGPQLQALPRDAKGPLDLTGAACNGEGRCVAVGRRGALLAWGDSRGETAPQRLDSPSTQDLWAVAADPTGPMTIVAGSAGAVLIGDGRRFEAETVGSETWYATWLCPDGSAWLGGSGGALAERGPSGRWQRRSGLTTDVMAGACDADGRVLAIGRGGQAFLRKHKDFEAVPGSGGAEITAAVGFQAQFAISLPRSAKRIVPASEALPTAREFPADAEADRDLPEAQRSTPRRGFSAPLLFGALSHGKPMRPGSGSCEDCYNSAVLMARDGEVLAIHDKAFLLAFGEYMPFGDRFPKLYEWSPETSHFQFGTKTSPIEWKIDDQRTARLGMLICYEDLLPRYARRVAAHNPNLLINLTNDAWFGQTAEPEHHLNLALMRSVEYRRWLIRSTNTGISVLIDAAGRRVAETKLTGAETLLRKVPLLEQRTVYAALGDWPLLALGGGLLLLWLLSPGSTAPKRTASKKSKVRTT